MDNEELLAFKSQIKDWLKEIGKNRIWLGAQCGGASKRTVDTWLSAAGDMPDNIAILIGNLMHTYGDKEATGECDQRLNLVLNVDAETYGQFAAWAKESGFAPTPDGIAKWAVQVMHIIGSKGLEMNPDDDQ